MASEITKSYRFKFWVFEILHLVLFLGPLLGYLIYGFSSNDINITTANKVVMSMSAITCLILGLIAFIGDTACGVLFAKFLNLFCKKENRLNPMIGACGISAFPMASRVVQKIALEDDDQNFILMHAVSANVSGQIGSVLIGGLILGLVPLL